MNYSLSDRFSGLYDARRIYKSIVVGPTEAVLQAPAGSLFRGGPRWPQFGDEVESRHCRGITPRPIDDEPLSNDPAVSTIAEGVWCGPVARHYGHMIADFGMRIAQSALLSGNTPLLFSIPQLFRGKHQQYVPSFFWSILDVYDIPRSRIVLIDSPVTVDTLTVYPQSERLWGGPPSSEHLNFIGQIGSPEKTTQDIDVLYVSRSKHLAGGIAGEAYVDDVMMNAGATVTWPELLPVREQLNLYRRAKKIVFSEGSAIHTLQLGGALNAEVDILCRRSNSEIARASVQPRVTELRYVDCVKQNIYGVRLSGHDNPSKGITLLDQQRFKEELEKLSPSASNAWSGQTYQQAADADVKKWFDLRMAKPKKHPDEIRVLTERMRDAGISI
ncbi:MAG: glycosyltransferase 61 family protein [Stagnimonas sp.]|nr:glycosyltransferase 61 family protein [Stagnimonas sp.]